MVVRGGLGGTIAMTPIHRTPLFFAQLLVVACYRCGAVISVSKTKTATRACRFNGAMAAPLSSFQDALSARPFRNTLSLHRWHPLSDPRLPFDDIAGRWLRASRTTLAGVSPACDSERQRQCPAPPASPVQPPSPLRMLRSGPHPQRFYS
ncbi:hypothetical protein MRX96_054102 [Rhipicephalus microplus]